MKVRVMGVKLVTGLSKASGEPFSIPKVFAFVPVENVKRDKLQVVGYGYEPAEMEVLAEAVPGFAGVKFPCELDLVVDQKLFGGELKMFVTGFVPVAKAA